VGSPIARTSADFALRPAERGQQDSASVYDPYRDTVIADNDVVLQSLTAIIGEIPDGQKSAVMVRAGAVLRHHQACVSKDISTASGGMAPVKPGRKPGWPTNSALCPGYLRDVDRALRGAGSSGAGRLEVRAPEPAAHDGATGPSGPSLRLPRALRAPTRPGIGSRCRATGALEPGR
jgi:hypothetical protein